jgi:acyl carrier protein
MQTKEIALEVIAKIEIAPDSELVGDLGIDSPKALAMLVELEDRLDVEIDDEAVTRLRTVADVLGAIEQQG